MLLKKINEHVMVYIFCSKICGENMFIELLLLSQLMNNLQFPIHATKIISRLPKAFSPIHLQSKAHIQVGISLLSEVPFMIVKFFFWFLNFEKDYVTIYIAHSAKLPQGS